jgi:3',5'-cyclic AMP phosphodiesterase CpdA
VRIVQMSDIHVGSTFVPELMDAAIEEINAYSPHLVAIPGDLTTKGYREEFEAAKTYLDRSGMRRLFPGGPSRACRITRQGCRAIQGLAPFGSRGGPMRNVECDR